MVMPLMQYLLTFTFESSFNFFIAWCRTQRAPTIHRLCSLYKFGHTGSSVNKACLDRFFRIAANSGFADAIVYKSCWAILSASGNIDIHFSALDSVASGGHYMSLAANSIVQIVCRHQDHEIAPALIQLELSFRPLVVLNMLPKLMSDWSALFIQLI